MTVSAVELLNKIQKQLKTCYLKIPVVMVEVLFSKYIYGCYVLVL